MVSDDQQLLFLKEIYYKSKEIGYLDGQLPVLLMSSNIYYNTGKINEALSNLKEADALSRGTNDIDILSHIKLGRGYCFTKLGLYEKSLLEFKNALKNSQLIKSDGKRHYLRMCAYIGMFFNHLKIKEYNKETLILYAKSAYLEAKSLDRNREKVWLIQCTSNLAYAYLVSDKNQDQGVLYIKEAEKLLEGEKENKFFSSYYVAKGMLANKTKNYDEAVSYFQKSIQLNTENKHEYDLLLVYPEISASYNGLADYKNAALYLDKFKKLSDSITYVEKKAAENYFNNSKITNQSSSSMIYYYIAFGLLGVFALFVFLYFRLKQKRNISVDQNQLPEKPADDSHLVPSDDAEKKASLTKIVFSNDQDFYSEFISAYPDFIQKLLSIDTSFKTSDLEYCALIKLNFDTKQIAVFKNTSIKAVEGKKYRLKKRLSVPSDTNLYIWISQL
ncbi:hypothetical protein NZ698_01240 [Chryseobacterium sp. PBS4-4]|uniref:Tetratricopeptide repeat protein n=1 Tax=Chryseobacterium edaphi TaxID=2976532 RepID=A0ABT2W0M6_9FLAO|nr:hypothetical protein [Chryseobacterium edaphi]MCU7615808.1 hypothetical protein [Chryseobacterium edaphi]